MSQLDKSLINCNENDELYASSDLSASMPKKHFR